MKKVIIGILAIVGLLAIGLAAGIVVLVLAGLLAGGESVPSRVILEADFERQVVESIPDDPLARYLMEDVLELTDVVDAIDRGARDPRVKVLVARIGSGGMGLAHIQEIRDAVARFRAAGKPALAFAETFGEFGPGNGGYYLASAFEKIYLQPSGDVNVTGLIYEVPFIRGTLEKLGVEPEMGQRQEYKNAMNFYTDRALNEPFRESMQALMDSQFSQIVRGVAESRGLDEATARARFDAGPFLGREAQEAGLVDGLVYRDEVEEMARDVAGSGAKILALDRYLRAAGRPHRSGPTVALVQGHGAVVRGSNRYSPTDGSASMGSDSVTRALRAAIEDSGVKAILFRVDSPGGSYVASDAIWRETARAREAGKPVIVSMGNLAGSGGYFVAMNADKIVAEPGTITASIGVLGGKLLTREFWSRLGVSWDDVATSAHARMWTGTYPYGTARERFEDALDRIYEDFTSRVAEGRDLPIEKVLELARGRIWTGEDAKRLGLVDELGGMDTALGLVRQALQLPEDAPLRVRRFPARRSMLELLLSRNETEAAVQAALRRSAEVLRPAARLLRDVGLAADPGPLGMPPGLAGSPD
jgi:protease-4